MAPKYKLVYFNLRGRGELIRLAFHSAGVDFEDHRVEFQDWPALKPKTPEGTLPYLVIDGKEFGESGPLARYVARKYHLLGKNEFDELNCDIVLSLLEDIRGPFSRARNDKSLTDEQKKDLEKKVITELLPNFLNKIEKKLEQNKSGYIISDSLTIADLGVFDLLETPLKELPNLLDKHPKVSEHRKKVQAHPRLRAYLEKRPDTKI